MSVTIAFSDEVIGRIKPLNGGNQAPPLHNEENPFNNNDRGSKYIREAYADLHLDHARLHDSPLENPGMRLVDIHMIFGNFHADPEDPRNYYFEQTDDYIANCIAGGTPIYYRLGASIEHSLKKYFVKPPADYAKWIEIASHIIRHYNEGWANGFHYGIEYWEIWNEPDLGPKMWTGTEEEFFNFYLQAATELKKRFPHLKIGGPGNARFLDHAKRFLKFCAGHHAPLDFYSYHKYTTTPFEEILTTPFEVRKYLDELGYTKTEIHVNEWHYVFATDAERAKENGVEHAYKGLEAGAAAVLVMSRWQDTPVDKASYYTVTTSPRYGLFFNGKIKTKSYYAFLAFGKLTRYPERLRAESSSDYVSALAGRCADGSKALLISCYRTGSETLEISGCGNIEEILIVDDAHDLEPVEYENIEGKIRLPLVSDSSVVFIRFH